MPCLCGNNSGPRVPIPAATHHIVKLSGPVVTGTENIAETTSLSTSDRLRAIEIVNNSPQTQAIAPIGIIDLKINASHVKLYITTFKNNLFYEVTVDTVQGKVKELKMVPPRPVKVKKPK